MLRFIIILLVAIVAISSAQWGYNSYGYGNYGGYGGYPMYGGYGMNGGYGGGGLLGMFLGKKK
ncbi:CaeNaCin (Caenorhabditis bacteriocin) [Caenorhabditis elegans]|uniref:CaeNaCin (Caenorhabditis bacteriocin) n=1 Tax=Caenorhabditis elegans TaxID=6239 RepID=O44615_CAEEL|nr:CaeNaCin (Caenorhabditis bacteriocin) [Caenorhabditis elegans]CCD68878.1 CaeNaCin (Caenorhabditis bacteriocin) [Caenorhabditis elegans]|eukprot:NP_503414.1 CaeNaCin (Caenorhabditis bacteriocin) [Caenorhabditis elegans]